MRKKKIVPIVEKFKTIKDPRISRQKLHSLEEILLLVLCATICGADSWRDMVLFGKEKLSFLREYLPYKNGIPSKSTFCRVFGLLQPEAFKAFFNAWMQMFQSGICEVIAIDGKALRHSYDRSKGLKSIFMVSAYASKDRLVLAQQKVDEKSNEITAVPELLKLLNLEGAVVTLDAMGCQKSTVKDITDYGGDYAISLKGNQSNLHKDVALYLESAIDKGIQKEQCVTHQSIDKGHGRLEVRTCWMTENIDWIPGKENWAGFKSIGMIESSRTLSKGTTLERLFFISSLSANPELFLSVIRDHWRVENNLHWTLDVTFGEDGSRVRDRNATENMAMIRHATLNLLQQAKPHYDKDISIKGLRKKAGWGNETLARILSQKF